MRRSVLVGRGVSRRCPRCGGGGLFDGYWSMKQTCPTCGMRFERDPGYWLGAMIVNTAVTIGTFLVVLVGAVALTWPDVPWTPLVVGTMALNVALPVLFYPFSKTIFVAFDLSVRPLSDQEAGEADGRVAAGG